MAQIASPYGLRPVQLFGGLPFAGAIRSYPLLANSTSGFFFGDPVALVNGSIAPVTASPTNATTANNPIGIFMGAEYQDPIRGFVNSQWFPANGFNNYTGVRFKILDYPWVIFRVQANGSIPQAGAIGMNTALVITPGNTATGNSNVACSSAVAVTATLALRVVGFPKDPSSAPGDPFTDILATWNFGVHRLMNSLAI